MSFFDTNFENMYLPVHKLRATLRSTSLGSISLVLELITHFSCIHMMIHVYTFYENVNLADRNR